MPVLHEQPLDRAARLRSEHRERRILGGGQRDRHVDVHVVGAAGGHQREFVKRQWPRHRRWADERQLVNIASLDVLDQSVELLVELAVIERHGMLEPRAQDRSGREQQRVVLELLARLGVHGAAVRVSHLNASLNQVGADVAADLIEWVVVRLAVAERFADPHRAVDELGCGGEHGGGDTLAREVAQRKSRFEAGDAAADDQDSEWGVGDRVHVVQPKARTFRRQPRRSEPLLRKTT